MKKIEIAKIYVANFLIKPQLANIFVAKSIFLDLPFANIYDTVFYVRINLMSFLRYIIFDPQEQYRVHTKTLFLRSCLNLKIYSKIIIYTHIHKGNLTQKVPS